MKKLHNSAIFISKYPIRLQKIEMMMKCTRSFLKIMYYIAKYKSLEVSMNK